MAGLLRGVKVVELGVILPSSYLGGLLADQGAEVIKIETPPHGDYIRDFPDQVAAHQSKYHLVLNRNKKSLALDIRKPEGLDVLHRLVQRSDVFFTNLIAGEPERLGAGYEVIGGLNPGIIYCQLTGFGATGPYARIPTHGFVMSAATAQIPVAVGPDGRVRQVPETMPGSGSALTGTPVVVGPLFAAYGIAAALWRRATTDRGAFLEISDCDCVLSASWTSVPDALNEGRIRPEAVDPLRSAKHSFYETSDGKHIFIALIEPKFWTKFCSGVGRDDLLEGQDRTSLAFDFGDEAMNEFHFRELHQIFKGRTRDEWVDFFVEHDLPAGPVNTLRDLDGDRQFRARGVFVDTEHPVAGPFRMVGEPLNVQSEEFRISPAPAVGEHTEEILAELGYASAEITRLEEAGVILRAGGRSTG